MDEEVCRQVMSPWYLSLCYPAFRAVSGSVSVIHHVRAAPSAEERYQQFQWLELVSASS